jgi:hypothetical protein
MVLNELLPVLRHNAQATVGEVVAQTDDDSKKDAALKKAGLFEIAHLNDDEHDPEQKAFVDRLIAETLRGFVAHDSHYRGMPPQIMAIDKARRDAAAGGQHAMDIAEIRERQTQNDATTHQRIDALESGVAEILKLLKTPSASATIPTAETAKKEGQ